MTGGVLGGGVIFVIAALLWAAVLVPAWIRRREFRAAERNAARLQRTLRVLAETAEVPQEVHLEATARQALAHEKLLRTAQKRQEAERQAELAEARAVQVRAEIHAQRMQRKQAAVQRSARLRKPVVRRFRALAALGALVGLIGALVGIGFAVAGSGVAIVVWSGLVFCASLGALVLMAPGRVRLETIPAEQVAPVEPASDVEQEIVATEDAEQQAAAHAAAQQAAAARIERARALARNRAERPAARENQPDSMLLREAREQAARDRGAQGSAAVSAAARPAEPQRSAASEALPQPAAPGAAGSNTEAPGAEISSEGAGPRRAPAAGMSAQQRAARERLRQMGVIGDTSAGMPDLDAVLRRRRNAS
ncbi:hypothetical protein [Leucobacter sp.]